MSACRRWTPQSGASGFRQFLSRLEGEALLSALTHTVVTIEVGMTGAVPVTAGGAD